MSGGLMSGGRLSGGRLSGGLMSVHRAHRFLSCARGRKRSRTGSKLCITRFRMLWTPKLSTVYRRMSSE